MFMITLVKHRPVEIDCDSQNTRPEGAQPSFLHGTTIVFSVFCYKKSTVLYHPTLPNINSTENFGKSTLNCLLQGLNNLIIDLLQDTFQHISIVNIDFHYLAIITNIHILLMEYGIRASKAC